MTIFWVIVFFIALFVLVKGADFMLSSSERIGLALGMSPFAVGVIIVGLGTSFPELASSFVAVIQHQPEIVTANAVGSNVANILLVVGLSALIGGRLAINKSLIDIDLPLLALSTVIFWISSFDGLVTITESIVLLATFAIYLLYIVHNGPTNVKEVVSTPGIGPTDTDADGLIEEGEIAEKRGHISLKDFGLLFIGIAMLILGAKYLIDSVIRISEILNLLPSLIALVAVALGTSLPELLVSIKAALHGHADVALGNIFGSNVFNLLVVVGLPGLFGNLPVDVPTLTIAIPALIVTTVLFVISGISRRVHIWEGGMYIILYLCFIGKLFGFL